MSAPSMTTLIHEAKKPVKATAAHDPGNYDWRYLAAATFISQK